MHIDIRGGGGRRGRLLGELGGGCALPRVPMRCTVEGSDGAAVEVVSATDGGSGDVRQAGVLRGLYVQPPPPPTQTWICIPPSPPIWLCIPPSPARARAAAARGCPFAARWWRQARGLGGCTQCSHAAAQVRAGGVDERSAAAAGAEYVRDAHLALLSGAAPIRRVQTAMRHVTECIRIWLCRVDRPHSTCANRCASRDGCAQARWTCAWRWTART